jgi:hypothetical protein
MLFRYTADDHLLLDGTGDAERTMHKSRDTVTSTPPAAGGESSSPSNTQHQTQNNATTAAHDLELQEAKTQYYEHVDTALTTLLCAPVNPLLPAHIKTREWS